MDDATKAGLLAEIRESGDYAVSEGLVERAEVDAALSAAERGDEREARGFFLLALGRMTEAWGL